MRDVGVFRASDSETDETRPDEPEEWLQWLADDNATAPDSEEEEDPWDRVLLDLEATAPARKLLVCHRRSHGDVAGWEGALRLDVEDADFDVDLSDPTPEALPAPGAFSHIRLQRCNLHALFHNFPEHEDDPRVRLQPKLTAWNTLDRLLAPGGFLHAVYVGEAFDRFDLEYDEDAEEPTMPLLARVLPAHYEFWARDMGDDEDVLVWRKGGTGRKRPRE